MTIADFLLLVFAICGIPVALIGLVTVIQFIRPADPPMDESNRINRIRLWWFALTRPELFVGSFPWLRNDEWKNVR